MKNYEFMLVEPTLKAGPDKTITVKLVDKTTGKAIPDALIFATRLDMAPDGMQEMATKVTPMPGTEPGTVTTPWMPASVNAVPTPRTAAAASSSQPTRLPGTARVMTAPTTAVTAIAAPNESVSANTAVAGLS